MRARHLLTSKALMAGIAFTGQAQAQSRSGSMMRRDHLWTTALLAISAAATGQAAAQDAGAAGVSEVVITAQKRSENLQDTPLAVTALQADALAEAGVKGFVDINKVAPDVTVNTVVGATNIAIRGVRAASLGPTAETPTAVHINGAFLSRQTGLSGMFYDLERVEVLKGPQGTLYGRNATGGVVNLITRKPGDSFETSIEAEAGNYDLQRLEAAVNMPLSDVFAVRVAGRHYEHDGYFENGLEDAKESGARALAEWRPNEKFTLLASGDYQVSDRRGPGIAIIEARTRSGGLAAPVAVLPDDPFDQTFLYPLGTARAQEKSESYGTMLQADYDLGFATATMQAANRRVDFVNTQPTVQFGGAPTFAFSPAASNTTSVELRLASNERRPLEWVTGLFYFHETNSGDMCQRPTFTSTICQLDIANPYTNGDAYAAFGQATYTPSILDERLHLTLGLRYNEEGKQAISSVSGAVNFRNGVATNAAGVPTAPGAVVPARLADDWSRLTGKVGASFDITPDNMVYASYSTGFKAGGFAYGSQPAFQPEYIDAYEIGTKNQFLDRRLQINGSAYYYEYEGQLRNVMKPPLVTPGPPFSDLTVANVGSTTYKGASIDAVFAVTANDQVNLNLEYQKAEYDTFVIPAVFVAAPPLGPNGLPAPGYAVGNFSGSEPPNVPDWSGRAGYSHFFSVAGGELEAHADVQFSAKAQISDQSFPGTLQYVERPSYARGDVSLSYAPEGAAWKLTGYVNNVTDERTFATGAYQTTPPTAGFVTGPLLPPRTFGLIFSTKFDGK